MSFNPTSPVAGATVAGLTSPTYTLTVDLAPAANGKQFAVTALGGTQTGVDINSVSKPFTSTFFRPQVLKTLPAANPVTGVIKSIPLNQYKLVTRKGAQPASNQPAQPINITTSISVPAGVDTFEPEELKAALSAHFGILWQQASGISDTCVSGVM